MSDYVQADVDYAVTVRRLVAKQRETADFIKTSPSREGVSVDIGLVHVEAFGADPTGKNDSTAAFLAAQRRAYNYGGQVYAGQGVFLVHELNMGYPGLRGLNKGQTKLKYNGAGGPGSFVYGINNATPSSGGYECQGFSVLGEGKAESGIKFTGVSTPEYGLEMNDLVIQSIKGNGIHNTNGVINWYMNTIRFDDIGGYGIYCKGSSSMEARPFVLRDWTMDTGVSSVPGDRHGMGLAKFVNCQGLKARFEVGRFEGNSKLVVDGLDKNIIRVDREDGDTVSKTQVILDCVMGFTQAGDGTILLNGRNNALLYTPGDIRSSAVLRATDLQNV